MDMAALPSAAAHAQAAAAAAHHAAAAAMMGAAASKRPLDDVTSAVDDAASAAARLKYGRMDGSGGVVTPGKCPRRIYHDYDKSEKGKSVGDVIMKAELIETMVFSGYEYGTVKETLKWW